MTRVLQRCIRTNSWSSRKGGILAVSVNAAGCLTKMCLTLKITFDGGDATSFRAMDPSDDWWMQRGS